MPYEGDYSVAYKGNYEGKNKYCVIMKANKYGYNRGSSVLES